jgi:glycine cleavage system H protein
MSSSSSCRPPAWRSRRRSHSDVNAALADKPELVNDDPYGAGWMIRVRLSDPESATQPSERLLDADAYRSLIEAG